MLFTRGRGLRRSAGPVPSDSHPNDLREAAVQRTNVEAVHLTHRRCAIKAIYIVKSNYPSSARGLFDLDLKQSGTYYYEKRGLFLDEGGLPNRGISLYTIQHCRFNYFPTQMKREEHWFICALGDNAGFWDRENEKKKEVGRTVQGEQSRSHCIVMALKGYQKFSFTTFFPGNRGLSDEVFSTGTNHRGAFSIIHRRVIIDF